jgi:ABC-type nitrate/sulfonate/bicarbonate transport system permease component
MILFKHISLYFCGIAATFAIWYLLAYRINNNFILPSPVDVLAVLGSDWEKYVTIGGRTLLFALTGLLLSGALALAVGSVAAIWRQFDAVYPLLVTVKAIPAVVVAPILSTAIGSGFAVKCLVACTISVFPVAIATIEGLRHMPEPLAKLGLVYTATRLRMLNKVGYVYMLDGWLSGLQAGAPLAVIGAIVAEFVDPSRLNEGGVGLDIAVNKSSGQVTHMFAGALCAVIIGVASFYLLLLVTRLFQRAYHLGK